MKKIFYNGKIISYTKDSYRYYYAMVVSENRIENLILKNDFELVDYNSYECIDLKARTVVPGFNDSHMHLINYGFQKYKLDFSKCDSIEAMRKIIIEFLSCKGHESLYGEWIVGYGWNELKFKEKRLPTRKDFDDILPNIPFFAARICGHIALGNTFAFNEANINLNSENPEGGSFDRGSDSKINGIARENALFELFNAIPLPNNKTVIKSVIRNTILELNKKGITSVQTDDFSHVLDPIVVLECFDELRKDKLLNCRICEQQLFLTPLEFQTYIKSCSRIYVEDDEYFKRGPLKILADGSFGAKTAALFENYNKEEHNGILAFSDSKMDEFLEIALKNNMTFAVHAIGDRAMDQVLRSKRNVEKKYGYKFKRPKLVHCQIGSKQIFELMAAEGVGACIQPVFLMSDYTMIESRISHVKSKYSYAWKSMLREGVHISGSSDAPIESFDPFIGIYSAVTRMDLDCKPSNGWNSLEKLNVNEALKLFTLNSAFDTFEENIKGDLKVGKLADFVVLSENILEVNPIKICEVEVVSTIFDGNYVYKNKNYLENN